MKKYFLTSLFALRGLITLLMIFFCVSLISAQPSFFLGNNDQGFNIYPTIQGAISIKQNHTIDNHVTNVSDGYPIITKISCYGHLYNKEGHHTGIYETSTTEHIFDYPLEFDQGNFSRKGEYILKTHCNDTKSGGFNEIYFYVTTYGDDPAGDIFKIFIYVLFIVVTLGSIFYLFMSILNMILARQTIFGVLTVWTFYFGLILTNFLAKAYLLDYFIQDITANIILWGGWPLFLIPMISLIISMIKKSFDKKNLIDAQELTGRRFFGFNG